jgi:ABC-type branched-subunit amino acid transport system ATPase component
MDEILRQHAEIQFADELQHLQDLDGYQRPPNWNLSPWAVAQYILGGTLKDGTEITPKYFGERRIIEIAIATLATDRALLLIGVPGTGKTWLSEHLAAAISGDSTLLVQGTAGTPEESIRYGWNYARLLQEGPTINALVPSPVMRAMERGAIARVEEMTRIPSDVQDALITVLSEKTLPIPELNSEAQAVRRFNTVGLPLPHDIAEEVGIVQSRVESIGRALELPPQAAALDEIRRVVTIFRELRNGMTEDGHTRLNSPSSTLSTAEAISVLNHGIALAMHFGNGKLSARDIAAGIVGAIVKDPVQDKTIWLEYLETVVKNRQGWIDLYDACREVSG